MSIRFYVFPYGSAKADALVMTWGGLRGAVGLHRRSNSNNSHDDNDNDNNDHDIINNDNDNINS